MITSCELISSSNIYCEKSSYIIWSVEWTQKVKEIDSSCLPEKHLKQPGLM